MKAILSRFRNLGPSDGAINSFAAFTFSLDFRTTPREQQCFSISVTKRNVVNIMLIGRTHGGRPDSMISCCAELYNLRITFITSRLRILSLQYFLRVVCKSLSSAVTSPIFLLMLLLFSTHESFGAPYFTIARSLKIIIADVYSNFNFKELLLVKQQITSQLISVCFLFTFFAKLIKLRYQFNLVHSWQDRCHFSFYVCTQTVVDRL